jgi:hypothetical protein
LLNNKIESFYKFTMSAKDQLLRACLTCLYNEQEKENLAPLSATAVKPKKERKPYVQTEARKAAFAKCQEANRLRRERLRQQRAQVEIEETKED